MVQTRLPAVAGQFYPLKPQELKNQIKSFIDSNTILKRDALACMLPHAGYIYSGKTAAGAVSRLKIRDRLLILGPNHTGFGEAFGIMDRGNWATPFGDVAVDERLACALLERSQLLRVDKAGHRYEHSIEVQLPILQYFKADFSFVPIVVGSADLKTYQELGCHIADVIKESGIEKDVLLVASSDMTHYEDAEKAKIKDNLAIEAILDLDESELWSRVNNQSISMCGYAPVIIMITAAKKLGAKKGELVGYSTSGDVTGDNSSVVGYAAVIIN